MVGAGAVGSVFLTELQKRLVALPIQLEVDVYDFDEVEERNLVGQDFYPGDLNKNKAEALAERLDCVDCVVRGHDLKITRENVMTILDPRDPDELVICVDGVDNYATRELLWLTCKVKKIPQLHMALSLQGQGFVNWTYKTHDTFHLSPARLTPDTVLKLKDPNREEPEVPPCELTTYRPLIWNTGFGGVQALTMYLGQDNGGVFLDAMRKAYPETDVNDMTSDGMLVDINTRKDGWEVNLEKASYIPPLTKGMEEKQKEIEAAQKRLIDEAKAKVQANSNE